MSYSEFDEKDFALIRHDWEILYASAKKRCADEHELAVVQQAFDFANDAHKNVRRRSGEPYMLHPIAVAQIVVDDIGLGYKSIAAALMHDVVEDTDYTVDDLRERFGDKIASLVDGLTKIKNVLDYEDKNKMGSPQSMQAENFKRILLTLNDDPRVVLIKLADRLHNCRTIEFMPEHKRDKILSETMFVFIPLAHRLGLYGIKSELENIWLRYKEPEAYAEIDAKIRRNIEERGKEMNAFVEPIETALTKAGFKFEIKKRVKTPYSAWHKMQVKQISFEQVYDLFAIRIIFDPDPNSSETERDQCYHVFSTITGIYRYMPERIRDWVRHPKSNGYEALHCTLLSPSGIWVEVQIRTRRMDDIAEKGIAAHWTYKQNGYIGDSEMDLWLSRIKEILVNPDVNALELLDIIHNDLTSTEIYVFTPKGEQRSIEKGATVLDFAYLIHTEIGNKAIAAKVNQRLVSLSHVVKTGDQVEIITAEEEHPKREWLQFLKTRKARSLVMDYFKNERKQTIDFGKYRAGGPGPGPGVQALRRSPCSGSRPPTTPPTGMNFTTGWEPARSSWTAFPTSSNPNSGYPSCARFSTGRRKRPGSRRKCMSSAGRTTTATSSSSRPAATRFPAIRSSASNPRTEGSPSTRSPAPSPRKSRRRTATGSWSRNGWRNRAPSPSWYGFR